MRARLALISVLLMFPAVVTPVSAQDFSFPQLTGRVVDAAGILSLDTERELTELLKNHENATTNQVVVVTVPSLQGYSIERYGVELGRQWGIGQEGKDNGVLLLVAPNERKVRIEVGYGLESTLTDASSKTIIERVILPRFRDGNMNDGIRSGAMAIVAVLGGEVQPGGDMRSFAKSVLSQTTGWLVIVFVFIIPLLIGLKELFGFDRTGKSHRPRRSDDPRYRRHYGYVSGYAGGSSGGFGGGGFSGGGGGFGGGGASGGW